MRQLVSIIKDNQIHYGLMDTETDQIVPFADLLIPDPERFGLNESALLGTNLIDVLGLNGSKRPKAQTISLATPPRKLDVEHDTPAALPPVVETKADKQRRYSRESYHRTKARKAAPEAAPPKGASTRSKAAPENKVQRFISTDEVIAVINSRPEGSTAHQIAQVIDHNDEPARWVVRTVENRLAMARMANRDKGTPLPYRLENEPVGDTKRTKRVLYPLAMAAQMFPVEPAPPLV